MLYFFEVSLLPLRIRNLLHVSLHVDMNTILKTRAFVHLRTDLDSSKETEEWNQYPWNDTKMPPSVRRSQDHRLRTKGSRQRRRAAGPCPAPFVARQVSRSPDPLDSFY